MYALADYDVAGSAIPALAKASAGHPLAVRLLGMRFGKLSAERAQALERRLLPELPKGNQPDEQWVRRFSAVVGASLLHDLPEAVSWHARAAAVLRAFDRPLLAHVLGESFRGDAYDELVATPLVEAPAPSPLSVAEETYRMRAFARQLLRDDTAAGEARTRWHARALSYYETVADKIAADPERQFAMRVEALLHCAYLRPDEAQAPLAQKLIAEQAVRRFDHCEMGCGGPQARY